MTVQVNIAKAKGRLSELVARAEAGEEVVLSRNGKAVATIKALSTEPVKPTGKRKLGILSHLGPLTDPDRFLRPDPEMEQWAESHDEESLYRLDRP